MGFILKKQHKIYAILGISLLITLFFWGHSAQENRAYEKYLSEQLVRQIANISQSAMYNFEILQDVIERGKLTKAQAGELQLGFRDIAFEFQDVIRMGNDIGRLRLQDFHQVGVVQINAAYYQYFLKLNMDSDEMELTEEQISILKTMEMLMKEYNNVVKETLVISWEVGVKGVPSDFRELYGTEKGIDDDYWVKLVKGFERVTDIRYTIDLLN